MRLFQSDNYFRKISTENTKRKITYLSANSVGLLHRLTYADSSVFQRSNAASILAAERGAL